MSGLRHPWLNILAIMFSCLPVTVLIIIIIHTKPQTLDCFFPTLQSLSRGSVCLYLFGNGKINLAVENQKPHTFYSCLEGLPDSVWLL